MWFDEEKRKIMKTSDLSCGWLYYSWAERKPSSSQGGRVRVRVRVASRLFVSAVMHGHKLGTRGVIRAAYLT